MYAMKKVRLDQLVFDLGLTESRERAKTTIMSGVVFMLVLYLGLRFCG